MEGTGKAQAKGAMPQHGILLIITAKPKADQHNGRAQKTRSERKADKGRESAR